MTADSTSPSAGSPPAQLLDEHTVLDHLRRRGVIGHSAIATAARLGGGVSNTVIAVEVEGSSRLIVKQALPRLRVAREWLADPARTCTEGRALQVAARFVPGMVPEVVDLDESSNVLTIAGAPAGTPDWKQRLLHDDVSHADVVTAGRLGTMLGRIHARSAADPGLSAQFDAWHAFEQLRITPYFRSMVDDAPALREVLLPQVELMARRRVCLVHGDVSPKNVLVGDGLLWLIDFEVACWGDPAFDVAFMLCHLSMKAMHRPAHASVLLDAGRRFFAAYVAEAADLLGDERHVIALLGCLLMARVDGRSQAEYLSAHDQATVRGVGLRLAASPHTCVEHALHHVMAVAA